MATRGDAPDAPSEADVVGLTSAEAATRLERDGPNALPDAPRPTLVSRVGRELREPMAVLLLVAAAVSGVLLDEAVEAVAILAIVVANAVIALVQEGRAERAMAALEALEAPRAVVRRDGRPRVVPARDLVVGDVVVLGAGDRVPADLVLVAGDAVEVDEAVLTGESLPVTKRPGGRTDAGAPLGDRDGCTFSGTLVTRGAGQGVVVATGGATALGAIAARLGGTRREPTPLQRQLAGLTRRLGGAAVVVGAVTFLLTVAVGGTSAVDQAFLAAVALAVAAVPEGLAAVTTVALALGVGRMARRGAIVRRLPAVETLGATDVLVIDKTGTVTENRMEVAAVVDAHGRSHAPDGAADVTAALAEVLALCNDAGLDPPTGDPTERALLRLVGEARVEELRARAPRLATAPFTADRRRMSTLHRVDGVPRLLCKGAPEAVLPRCATARTAIGATPLDARWRSVLDGVVERAAGDGGRVLALAAVSLPDGAPPRLEEAEHDLELLGLVVLRDPPRASAADSVAAVRAAGLELLMATGDHPATAVAIAREVGLDAHDVRSGHELRRDGWPDLPTASSVLARVDPDQKYELVERLQADGHVVAMTGDGVNDAPALRRADIGVALGATGSDVAREAADVVVTDDDLATIVAAVHEGRTIHDNLRKVVDYLVASNLSEVAVVVVGLLAVPALGVPLFPLQLLWINLLTDGLPALALGVDPAHPGAMTRPPRAPGERLLDGPHLRRLALRGAALASGALGAVLVADRVLGQPPSAARTVLFTTLVVAQAAYAWVVRRPAGTTGRLRPNPWLVGATVGALVLQVLVVVVGPLGRVFDTVPLTTPAWVLAAAGGLAGPTLVALVDRRRG
jgi:calcium-translocating P-type ATPase